MQSVFLQIEPGLKVRCDGRLYEVDRAVGPNWVYAIDIETGESRKLRTEHLAPEAVPRDAAAGHAIEEDAAVVSPDDGEVMSERELMEVAEEDWIVARKRFEMIRELLEMDERTSQDVETAAKARGVHFTTLYRWISAYQDAGHLSALIPQRRGPRRGTTALPQAVNDIVEQVIEEVYLTERKPMVADAIDEVCERCHDASVRAPHPNTVRNRIKRLPRATTTLRRHGRAAARDRFSPIRGEFPDADFPLSAVQIDHTEADVILVEEETRLAMGRPWVTLAIDVHTRMVVGLYVTMDRPSAIAVGLCLSRAMLEKTTYLEALGVEGDWPAFGRIRAVHADNAKEFRGRALERACAEHGIDALFRPVKVPHYGGHIERMMGVLAGEMRRLDGATFSSPKARGTYDATRQATMTLQEFESYLVDWIVNYYHRRRHGALGVSPLARWRATAAAGGGEDGRLAAPIPVVVDPERLVRDFMPFEERTIQRYGVSIHGVKYFDEVLTPWIDAREPRSARVKRKFTFRYDPRNLASVWFFDPELRRYFELPYRNLRNPAVSLWELRHARRVMREEGRQEGDEDALFDTVRRLRRRREDAKAKTKAARRGAHRTRATRAVGRDGPAAPIIAEPARATLRTETTPRVEGDASAGAPTPAASLVALDDVPTFDD